MGRRKLPANVHLLRGNPSKLTAASLIAGELRPPVEIPSCPKHLNGEAKKEWLRITRHLETLGGIAQIDRAALAAYCTAWNDYVWSERRIALLNASDDTGDRGRIGDTPSGYKQISVHLQIRNRAIELMMKICAEFGMTWASRSKVTPSDAQPSLPGMEAPKEGGWGNV